MYVYLATHVGRLSHIVAESVTRPSYSVACCHSYSDVARELSSRITAVLKLTDCRQFENYFVPQCELSTAHQNGGKSPDLQLLCSSSVLLALLAVPV